MRGDYNPPFLLSDGTWKKGKFIYLKLRMNFLQQQRNRLIGFKYQSYITPPSCIM